MGVVIVEPDSAYEAWPLLSAVIEHPNPGFRYNVSWPLPEFTPRSVLRLHGGISDAEVALALGAIASFPGGRGREPRSLAYVARAPYIAAAGGVAFVSGGYRIGPGCCEGIEDWSGWSRMRADIETGLTEEEMTWPWWGHDHGHLLFE
jgi:hypothetical protein